MKCILKNQKVIRKWIKLLNFVLRHQILGLYDSIEKDYKMKRLIEVIEEYDDIIFGVDNNE